MSNNNDDFLSRLKKINDDFKKSMEEIDEKYERKKADLAESIRKHDEESDARLAELLKKREQCNKNIEMAQKQFQSRMAQLDALQEESIKKMEELYGHDPEYSERIEKLKQIIGYAPRDKKKLQ